MNVGLLDVDGHSGFPNLALMKISRWFKDRGDDVEWAMPLFGDYDTIHAIKLIKSICNQAIIILNVWHLVNPFD